MALPPLRQPAGTPCYLVGGHGIEPDALHDDFDFAVGHGRKRKVQTTAPRYVDVGLDLSEEQAAAYDAWFENALVVGNGQFTAEIAKLGTATRFWAAQWVDPPQWEPRAAAGGTRWRLTGRLLLTGEGSDTAPETGALGIEYIAHLTGSVSLASQVFFAMEYVVHLSASAPIAMEYRVELLPIITTGPVSFTPAAGSLTLTGRAPTITAARTVAPGAGALVLAGQAPSVTNTGTDAFFGNVVLLVDASAYTNGSTPAGLDVIGKTATYRNNAQIKTDQFIFGGSSLYLDGVNDRVSFADSADWAMGLGDATWEAWVRREGSLGSNEIILSQSASFGGFVSAQMYSNVSDLFQVVASDGTNSYTGTSTTVASDTWVHVSLCRQGANLYSSVAGTVSLVSSSLSGVTLLDSAGAMVLGAYTDADGSIHWKGWMDQIRITKGVARYTSNFTPPGLLPHS